MKSLYRYCWHRLTHGVILLHVTKLINNISQLTKNYSILVVEIILKAQLLIHSQRFEVWHLIRTTYKGNMFNFKVEGVDLLWVDFYQSLIISVNIIHFKSTLKSKLTGTSLSSWILYWRRKFGRPVMSNTNSRALAIQNTIMVSMDVPTIHRETLHMRWKCVVTSAT